MKVLITYLTIYILFATFSSCNKSDAESEIPTCIEAQITLLNNKPVQNPPAKIWEWKTANNTFYYITSDCCDQFNYLYDIDCNIVCAPDGGFTGTGDGKCPAFTEPMQKTLIWEDLRK